MNEFIDDSMVLPAGNWDKDLLLPILRVQNQKMKRRYKKAAGIKEEEEEEELLGDQTDGGLWCFCYSLGVGDDCVQNVFIDLLRGYYTPIWIVILIDQAVFTVIDQQQKIKILFGSITQELLGQHNFFKIHFKISLDNLLLDAYLIFRIGW